MKSLSLPKPLIMIMVGLPGAGKTYFATQFAETFGSPIVSIDKLRQLLITEPTYQKDEQELLQRVAEQQLSELLKTKQTIILDGTGHSRVERMQLAKQSKVAGYTPLIVWVQTDEATTKQRSMRPGKQIIEKPPVSEEQYTMLAKRFTPPNHTETYIVISGKHTYASQVKVVLKKLAQPRQSAAQTIIPPDRPAPPQKRRNIPIIR